MVSHHTSTLVEPLLKHPSYHGRQLSVDCGVSSSKGGHLLMSETGPSLKCVMWWQMAAKANKPTMAPPNLTASAVQHVTIGSSSAMHWWHH